MTTVFIPESQFDANPNIDYTDISQDELFDVDTVSVEEEEEDYNPNVV